MAIPNPFLDTLFLNDLYCQKHHKLYAKVVALNFNEDPLQEITGIVASGSVNVDGSSSMRRTCTLSLLTGKVDMNMVYWALRSKIKISIGLQNNVNPSYDDIIWFPLGTFIMTSLNKTLNAQGYTISIQGKDKMCLLDGSVGGQLFADHDFGKIEVITGDGISKLEDIKIYDIIRNAVHRYASEPYHNIIINDLDDCAVELLNYKGKDMLLFIYEVTPKDKDLPVTNILFAKEWKDSDDPNSVNPNSPESLEALFTTPFIPEGESKKRLPRDEDTFIFGRNDLPYKIIKKVGFNDTAGYRLTDLTYVGDLIIAAGGSVTSMLDKIISMLGEFEYFYDLQGRFVFQRKPIFVNFSWTGVQGMGDNKYYDLASANSSKYIYEFNNTQLIDSFANKPNILAIKNDYTIWGKLQGTSATIPVHLRCAIDEKPFYYYSIYEDCLYITLSKEEWENDWRSKEYIPDPFTFYKENYGRKKPDLYVTMFEGKDGWTTEDHSVGDNGLGDEINRHYAEYDEDYFKIHVNANGQYVDFDGHVVDTMWESYPSVEYKGTTYYIINKIVFPTPIIDDARVVDWRDIIYQMAYDGDMAMSEFDAQYNTLLARYSEIAPLMNMVDVYTPAAIQSFRNEANAVYARMLMIEDKRERLRDYQRSTDYFKYAPYYTDMLEYWPRLYSSSPKKKGAYYEYDADRHRLIEKREEIVDYAYVSEETKEADPYARSWQANYYWNPTYFSYEEDSINPLKILTPELLPFWMDFIDTESYLGQYCVDKIGRRSKVVKNDDIKSIMVRETPTVLFVDGSKGESAQSTELGYTIVNLPTSIANYFSLSSQGRNAKDELDSMIYEGTYCQETITLNSIPIYTLQPNTRIKVYDAINGINGDYIVKSFSIQLAHDGMMSINATKVEDSIL